MNGFSPAPKEQRLCALKSLIPEAFSEGKIDWEKLKAALGEDINFANERYVLNWAGKSDAFRILQQPSSSTLVPVREESVDFDNTQNIFIEGENLEVLKALQKSYFNKVKMIYIDPPYNTGNDSFIYPDKFSETKEEYLKRVGDKDESGYMLREGHFAKNSKENGQYHSNWLNMMMPRLYLAKNLLREDGVIFVSIDDNEVHNLRLLMNEIFGEENFVAEIVLESDSRARPYGVISTTHEYILFYTKTPELDIGGLVDENKTFDFEDEIGGFDLYELRNRNIAFNSQNRPNLCYPFYVNPHKKDGNGLFEVDLNPHAGWIEVYPQKSNDVQTVWRWGKDRASKNLNTVLFARKTTTETFQIVKKYREKTYTVNSVWTGKEIKTDRGTLAVKALFDNKKYFDFPKPVELLSLLLKIGSDSSAVVLDFFSGSGTTAHAVMQLNREDGGNRKYICVQLPEKCDEKSEAFKAGYKTIADIAKERIRRAGIKIRGEVEAEQAKQSGELGLAGTPEVKMPDLGFKVFRLEDSNFKQWRKTTAATLAEVEQQMLDFVDPVKPGAAVENIVYELLLKSGKDLNCEIVRGNGFYNVNGGELVLLLESASQEVVDSVIALAPAKVIALDSLFHGNDQLKTNTSLQFRDSAIEFITI